jgi:hypothetical protein
VVPLQLTKRRDNVVIYKFTYYASKSECCPEEKIMMQVDDSSSDLTSDELMDILVRFVLAAGYQPRSIARSCARMARELEDWDGKARKDE